MDITSEKDSSTGRLTVCCAVLPHESLLQFGRIEFWWMEELCSTDPPSDPFKQEESDGFVLLARDGDRFLLHQNRHQVR